MLLMPAGYRIKAPYSTMPSTVADVSTQGSGSPSSWGILIGHLRRNQRALLGKPTGNTPPHPASLPLFGHFQLPCPSLPPGLSALHQSRQAKQEQSNSHKIRHSADVYAVAGSCAGAFNEADAPWLDHGSCLQRPVSDSWRFFEGMVVKAEFPNLLIDTGAHTPPNTPGHDTNSRLCPPLCLEIGHQSRSPSSWETGIPLTLEQLWLRLLYKKKKKEKLNLLNMPAFC